MADCYRHADVAAGNKCFNCMQPICDACTSTRSIEILCRACDEKQRAAVRKAASVKIVVITVIVAAVAVGLGFLVKSYEPPYDYGRHGVDVKRLNALLEREPCDRQKTLDLLDTMTTAGDYRGVLQRADAFFAKCGDMPRLRWLTFASHKHLSEFDLAVAEATKLVESDPTDRDFPWWRADAYFLKGDYEKALADYKRVQELCPRCTVGWQVADTAEKVGRPCDGVDALAQTLSFHEDARDVQQLRARIKQLSAKCGEEPSPPAALEPEARPPVDGAVADRPGATPRRNR